MSLWVDIVIAVVAFGVLYILLLMVNAKYEVTNSPRRPMFVCERHGVFPKEYALDLGNGEKLDQQLDDGRTIREAFLFCPMCYEEKMAQAKKQNA